MVVDIIQLVVGIPMLIFAFGCVVICGFAVFLPREKEDDECHPPKVRGVEKMK